MYPHCSNQTGQYLIKCFQSMTEYPLFGSFCGFPWVETSTAGRVYDLCVYYMTGAPEGSPKVVLCGFFYVFMEKPGIRLEGFMTCVCVLGREPQRLNRKWFWRTRNYFLWPCSLAVPVLAWWVYAFCGSLPRNSWRLNQQWFWF